MNLDSLRQAQILSRLQNWDPASVALGLLAITFAFERTVPIVISPVGIVFTNTEILAGSAVAIWLVTLLIRRRQPLVPAGASLPIAAWLGALLASTALAPADSWPALHFTARMLTGVAVGWAAYDIARRNGRGGWLTACLALGGFLVASLGIAEESGLPAATQWLAQFKDAPTRVGGIIRVSSSLSYATIAAMVLELTFPLTVAWLLRTKAVVARLLLGLAGLVSVWALVLTLSRAGIVAAGMGLLIFAVAGVSRQHKATIWMSGGYIAVAAIFVTLSVLWNPVLTLRFFSENDQTWYAASYAAPDSVASRPGETLTIPVTVQNTGDRAWVQANHIALGYHLYRADGSLITYDGIRTPLAQDVPPGHALTVQAQMLVPQEVGDLRIEWDLVQEDVAWFSWKQASTGQTGVTVAGTPASSSVIKYTPPPSQEMGSTEAPSRLQLWATALKMFVAHPFLGVGPDNFRLLYGEYADVPHWNTSIHANNLYIEMLADTGIIGFGLFVWMAFSLMKAAAVGLFRQDHDPSWTWRVGLVASLVTWFVHGFADYFYEFTPTYLAFWMIAGLALAMAQAQPERS